MRDFVVEAAVGIRFDFVAPAIQHQADHEREHEHAYDHVLERLIGPEPAGTLGVLRRRHAVPAEDPDVCDEQHDRQARQDGDVESEEAR